MAKISELATNLKEPGIVALFLCFLCKECLVNKDLLNYGHRCIDPNASVVSSAASIYFSPSDCNGTTVCKRGTHARNTIMEESVPLPRHDICQDGTSA
jgi:hypothetical protein